MQNPALPATLRFECVRVCQYCDEEIKGDAIVSHASGRPATLCSPSCRVLYDRAAVRQGEFRWDVT
jgi:hypothetical protein